MCLLEIIPCVVLDNIRKAEGTITFSRRTGVLNWLAEIGASDPELSIPAPEVDMELVPRSNALQPRSKQSKRRVTEGGDGPSGPRRRVGQGKGAHDENGISIEVQVRLQTDAIVFRSHK